MREAFCRDCLFQVLGHVAFCLVHNLLVVLVGEHHLGGMAALRPFGFLLRDPLHADVQEEIEQAGLLIIPVSVLHLPAKQDVLSPKVPPFPQADFLAIMLQLDGCQPLRGRLRGIQPPLLIEPLLCLLENSDLLLLSCDDVQLVAQFRQVPKNFFEGRDPCFQ